MNAAWWIASAVLILGGLVALVAVCGGGIPAARRDRPVAQRRLVAALLVADHDLPDDGEIAPRHGCCEDCDDILDTVDAALANLDSSLAQLEADLAFAGRDLAGEVEGFLRDQAEGITPPVVRGPDDI